MTKVTTGRYLQQLGFINIHQFCEYIGKHENTVYTMHKRYPKYFEALAVGVAVKLGILQLKYDPLDKSDLSIKREILTSQIIELAKQLADGE